MMSAGAREGVVALGDGTVLLRRAAARFDVQLHRPEKRNALTAAMIDALHEVLDLASTERPAVIALSGVPGCFSAGADITAYQNAPAHAAELQEFTLRARDLCTRLTTTESIVIAIVDGIAMGGGFELVLAADLVVASATSRFALPEVRLGLIPGWGGTQRLVWFVGPNRAKELVLTGATMTASRAEDAGIVTHLVPAEIDLQESAEAYLEALTHRAPLALRAGKATIGASYDPQAGDTIGAELETTSLLRLFSSDDGKEGVSAFIEKRTPQFTGC